jgi:hypothetical protein
MHPRFGIWEVGTGRREGVVEVAVSVQRGRRAITTPRNGGWYCAKMTGGPRLGTATE